MRKRSLYLFAMVLACGGKAVAQTEVTVQLLDWVDARDAPGAVERLQRLLGQVNDFFVRITSPDVPRTARHLWRADVDGQNVCVMSADAGVRFPRWSRSGAMLYLLEADTNHDGRIDFKDDFLVRVLAVPDQPRTVGQGKSAVWSPDSRHIALVRNGKVDIVDLQGSVVSPGAAPGGQLIASDSRNPETARSFWMIDTQGGGRKELPDELRQKYLWLGALSPSGSKMVFTSTAKTSLIVQDVQPPGARRELAGRGFHYLDPSWSPDEKRVVYVSDRPDGPRCSGQ